MNDQNEIDLINKRLYGLEVPNEPIPKIMFYFTVLHDIIDYPFPYNFINFNNPYFKTNEEVKQFLSLAKSLNPEFLHLNNAIIYHNNSGA